MKKSYILVITSLAILSLFALLAGCSPQQSSPVYSNQYGNMGPGGMMGRGGMMGPGSIGPGGPYRDNGERITMEQAVDIAESYLRDQGNSGLEIREIMEFEYNFYVIFTETDTGINAFEALIDPYTGDMYPEPGPNMMWNSKYGMMSGMMWGNQIASDKMTVTESEAEKYAQEFIDSYLPGAKTEEPDQFYGYYTLHIIKDGQIYGMLSVNGYTGQVWYHSWHGKFISMQEFMEH